MIKSSDITSKNSIIESPSDEFYSFFENNIQSKNDKVFEEVARKLDWVPSVAGFIQNLKNSGTKYEIVFPDEILAKIQSGVYTLTRSLENRDHYIAAIKVGGKIVKNIRFREISNLEKATANLESLQNVAVMNSLKSISKQLASIEEKLNEIHQEFFNDRIGRLQSGYVDFISALKIENENLKAKLILQSIMHISESRSQIIESLKSKIKLLEKHKPGFWKTFASELFSVNLSKKQEGYVSEITSDFFFVQRSSQLLVSCYVELNESEAAVQSLSPIRDLAQFMNRDETLTLLEEWSLEHRNWDKIISQTITTVDKLQTSKIIIN